MTFNDQTIRRLLGILAGGNALPPIPAQLKDDLKTIGRNAARHRSDLTGRELDDYVISVFRAYLSEFDTGGEPEHLTLAEQALVSARMPRDRRGEFTGTGVWIGRPAEDVDRAYNGRTLVDENLGDALRIRRRPTQPTRQLACAV